MINKIGVALLSIVFLSACETGTVKTDTVKVYKYDGSVSCNQSSGTSIETMRLELLQHKVPIIAASCGSDGLIRAAVCGTSTGNINTFEINAAAYPAASALGYKPLSTIDDYAAKSCS